MYTGEEDTRTLAINICKSLKGRNEKQQIDTIEVALCSFGIMLTKYLKNGMLDLIKTPN